MASPSPTRPLTAAAAVLLALCLSSCTGGSGDGGDRGDGGGDTSPSAAASTTPAPTLPADVTPAPVPTKVANEPEVRQNVVVSGCAATDGGWGATGTATNPGKKDVSYQVTVFFTTTSATVVNFARTEVDVKAGATQKWSAAKKFRAPDEMLCVLRGVAQT